MNGHETSGGRGNNIVSSPIGLNYMTRLMAREVLLSNCFYDNMLSHRSMTGTRRYSSSCALQTICTGIHIQLKPSPRVDPSTETVTPSYSFVNCRGTLYLADSFIRSDYCTSGDLTNHKYIYVCARPILPWLDVVILLEKGICDVK